MSSIQITNENNIQLKYIEALNLKNKKNFGEAQTLFEAVISNSCTDTTLKINAEFQIAHIHYETSNWELALKKFSEIVDYKETYPLTRVTAIWHKAKIYWDGGHGVSKNSQEAITQSNLLYSLTKDPAFLTLPYFIFGKICSKKSDYVLALKYFKSVIAFNQDSYLVEKAKLKTVHVGIKIFLKTQSEHKEALKILDEANSINISILDESKDNTTLVKANFNKGLIFSLYGSIPDALTTYNSIIKKAPDLYSCTKAKLAKAVLIMGKLKENPTHHLQAKELLKDILTIPANTPKFKILKAQAALTYDNIYDAFSYFFQAYVEGDAHFKSKVMAILFFQFENNENETVKKVSAYYLQLIHELIAQNITTSKLWTEKPLGSNPNITAFFQTMLQTKACNEENDLKIKILMYLLEREYDFSLVYSNLSEYQRKALGKLITEGINYCSQNDLKETAKSLVALHPMKWKS